MRLIYNIILSTLFCISILCYTSCSDTQQSFNIKDGLKDTIEINFDSMYKHCDLISLKSDNGYVLAKNPSIVYADDNFIIINSDNSVYLFDGGGLFLREIGKFGKGHGEHGVITSCFYDKTNNIIYVCSFGNEIYCYSINGEYIKKIIVNIEKGGISRAFGLVDNSKIISVKNVYKRGGLKCYATIYNDNGNIDKEFLLYSDQLSFKLTTESFPIVYSFNNFFRVKLPFDNRLFTISREGDEESDVLESEELSPSRDLIENCENRKELYNEKCQVLDIKETSKHLYIICYFAMKYHSMIFHKETKHVIFSKYTNNPKEKGTIRYNKDKVSFWPSYCRDSTIFCLIADDGSSQNSRNSIMKDIGYSVLKIQER